MREILFRGKRLDNGEWVYGAYCPKNSDTPFGPMVERPSIIKLDKPYDGYWFDVDSNTVGQYTGLTDKNGEKIFEGDILEHHVQSNIIVCRGEVFWETKNGRWALRLNTMNPCFYMHNPKAVEVIGNIHDNPDLLKRGNND